MELASPSTTVDGGGDDVHGLSREPVTSVTTVRVFLSPPPASAGTFVARRPGRCPHARAHLRTPAMPSPRRRRATLVARTALLLLTAACRRDDDGVRQGTGTIEVDEIDLAPLSPARLVRVLRDEGDWVRAGDTVAVLTTATIRSDVDARAAQLSAAEAQLRDLVAGARAEELRAARSEVEAATAESARASRDAARAESLAVSQIVSTQQLQAAQTARATARARLDAAEQAYALLRDGPRPARVQAARAEVERARAALAGARGTAADLVLVSPIAGRVLARHAEAGEVLAAGEAVLTVGDVRRPWVRVYVGQDVLPHVGVGTAATATLDAMPDRPFAGRVVSVSDKAEFTPRVALTEEERADLLFGVKVELPDTTGTLKSGLPVTVRFASAPAGTTPAAAR